MGTGKARTPRGSSPAPVWGRLCAIGQRLVLKSRGGQFDSATGVISAPCYALVAPRDFGKAVPKTDEYIEFRLHLTFHGNELAPGRLVGACFRKAEVPGGEVICLISSKAARLLPRCSRLKCNGVTQQWTLFRELRPHRPAPLVVRMGICGHRRACWR